MSKFHAMPVGYTVFLSVTVAALWSTPLFAQTAPDKISIQGFVTSPGGVPVNSEERIQFFLRRNGVQVWNEQQLDVPVENGIFNVRLGDVTPLSNVAFYGSMELAVVFGNSGADTLNPKIELVSAPFALGLRNLRVDPETTVEGPNMIGGWSGNVVTPGVKGAFIGGGGDPLHSAVPFPNSVEANYGVVVGGSGNKASSMGAMVGGGSQNIASGGFSFLGGGQINRAIGGNSVVPGGTYNTARGLNSFAAGELARANHNGSFVWSDASGTPILDTMATTAENQFLIRATGGVGIGTNAPANEFHVVGNKSASASVQNHVGVFDNIATGSGADVLALRVGRTTAPENTNSFVTFVYNGNTGAGFVRGNGAGGVELVSSGSDYAEYLQHLDPSETFLPGEVVGVFGGRLGKRTLGADQLMVVSTAPIVVGNHSALKDDEPAEFSRVAFIGQAPVRVTGTVRSGDFLIPSGLNDGTALAVRPASIRPDQLEMVFATAWESADGPAAHIVNAAIGIDQAAAAAHVIQALQEQLSTVLERLATLEARIVN